MALGLIAFIRLMLFWIQLTQGSHLLVVTTVRIIQRYLRLVFNNQYVRTNYKYEWWL